MLRHHGACVKTKKNPEDRASIRCSEKDLDGFTLEGYLGCMLNGGRFSLLSGHLYLESGLVDGTYFWAYRLGHLSFGGPLTLFCES